MSLGTSIAIGLCIGVVMWLIVDNVVLIGAGLAIGIALAVARQSK